MPQTCEFPVAPIDENMEATERTLLCMLLGPNSQHGEERTKAKALWLWVDKLAEQLVETHPIKTTFIPSDRCRGVGPRLVTLLADALHDHSWADASLILERLIIEPKATAHIAHRVGMELIQQLHSDDEPILMEDLMKKLKLLLDLRTKTVGLDYFFYLFKEGMIHEARDVIQNYHKRAVVGYRSVLRKSPQDKFVSATLCRGYEGLTYYAEWLQPSEDMQPPDHKQQLVEKAIQCFSDLEDVKNTEVFIQPYLHLLRALPWEDRALRVIKKFCSSNHDNANAWKMLLQHYKQHKKYRKRLREPLKELCRLLPAESQWVLEYRELLKPNESCLEFLFKCLDYPENKDNRLLWGIFADELEKRRGSREAHDLWVMRMDWWPDFHDFCYLQSVDRLQTETLAEEVH
ncbi:hypothetical protein CAPTEDRAFT_194149 [Capitella teleta]|uniref:Uncharacterized protein n=1 Tax=Capitella teleta TaxID=283909 RepID=R7TED0_CAPTE|nr:hypothetical protein CAPTEDRAFT_194149 [Capitella teleta]|eukprot:ELT91837.1 hypothetical protein CAPTEDRAFT_194149 [Capitella teleta]